MSLVPPSATCVPISSCLPVPNHVTCRSLCLAGRRRLCRYSPDYQSHANVPRDPSRFEALLVPFWHCESLLSALCAVVSVLRRSAPVLSAALVVRAVSVYTGAAPSGPSCLRLSAAIVLYTHASCPLLEVNASAVVSFHRSSVSAGNFARRGNAAPALVRRASLIYLFPSHTRLMKTTSSAERSRVTTSVTQRPKAPTLSARPPSSTTWTVSPRSTLRVPL